MSGRGRREMAAAVACCALAGGLALSAGGQTWATATVQRRAPLPPSAEALTGAVLAPQVSAGGLVLLAAAGALVAVRGRGRPIVGVLTAVAGAALAWSGLRPLLAAPGAGDLPEGAGVGATAVEVTVHAGWPVLAALAGVLALAGGALAAARGRGWAGMGRRYERAGAGGAPARPRTDEDRVLDAWRALDRGEDPTEEPAPPPAEATRDGDRPG